MIDSSGERMIVNYKDPDMDSGTDWLPQKLPPEIDGILGDHHWAAGTEHLFRLAREAGKAAILDADRQTSMQILTSATHIGFSARGLREQSGVENLPEALAWRQTQMPGWLAGTDGANGAWFTANGSVAHEPALDVPAVDTNGAGDVWHGALAVALLEGQEPGKAVRFANAAASIKCSRLGGRSAIPTRTTAPSRKIGGAGFGRLRTTGYLAIRLADKRRRLRRTPKEYRVACFCGPGDRSCEGLFQPDPLPGKPSGRRKTETWRPQR
jgi:sulfofructose kinase